MKRVSILLIAAVILVACNHDDVLSDSFKSDIDQVIPIIKKAHKEQEDYREKDSDLLDDFHNKYKRGQYYVKDDGDYYEMNDVEKVVFRRINTMRLFSVDTDDEETSTLASESKDEVDRYKEAKESLGELMKVNKVEDLPEEFKDKYPTYEVVGGMFPQQFEKDANELVELYEPIINGIQSDVTDKEWYPLEDFLKQYRGDYEIHPTDYEQEGKHYLINSVMRDVIRTFSDLESDIDQGSTSPETRDDFNSTKEDLDSFSSD